MTIQDFGAIGEIVGGIAVIATLIYLAIQVKQSNVSTHRNMYAQAATTISGFWLTLAKQPDLYRNFTTVLRDPDSLAPHERDQGFLVMDSYLSLMESYYLHNIEYGEEISQQRWGRMLRRMLSLPGGRRYWSERRASFHDEFAAYIDETALGDEPSRRSADLRAP